jgi:hypothetical protein
MSEVTIAPSSCEFINEIEASAREVRRKAGGDWSSPVAMAYYQCSLELRRIVFRHTNKEECAACREDEDRREMSNHPHPSMKQTYRDHSHQPSMGVTQ